MEAEPETRIWAQMVYPGTSFKRNLQERERERREKRKDLGKDRVFSGV